MTLNDLKSYRILKQEQMNIEEKIAARSFAEDDTTKELEQNVKKQYRQKLAELLQKTLEIEEAIKDLPPLHEALMRLHYIDGKTWEKVAEELNYSERQIKRLHKKALAKMSLYVTSFVG